MSFDCVAPHYRWLETLVFGQQLQQARVAFVREIGAPRRVLVVGEGNGRFLAEFVRVHPAAEIDCVDASGRMIQLAQRRVGNTNVRFIRGDLREVDLPAATYDLVVTHFFLDCFEQEALSFVIRKLASSAAPNAQWLIADFCLPEKNWRHLPSKFLIALMYAFFRVVCGIEACGLVDYRAMLQAEGFSLAGAKRSPNEMIHSEFWRRTSLPG